MLRLIGWLVVLVIVALLFFGIAMLYKHYAKENDRRARIAAEEAWTGECEFDNLITGARCQRQEFHLENHYRDIDGKLVTW